MGKNKDKSILIRLTEREFNIIQIKADESNLRVSEYIRRCSIDQKIKGLSDAKLNKMLKELEQPAPEPVKEEQIEGQMSIEELELQPSPEKKKRGRKPKSSDAAK